MDTEPDNEGNLCDLCSEIYETEAELAQHFEEDHSDVVVNYSVAEPPAKLFKIQTECSPIALSDDSGEKIERIESDDNDNVCDLTDTVIDLTDTKPHTAGSHDEDEQIDSLNDEIYCLKDEIGTDDMSITI